MVSGWESYLLSPDMFDWLVRLVDRYGLGRIVSYTFSAIGVLGVFGIVFTGSAAVVVVLGSSAFFAVLLLAAAAKRIRLLDEEIRLRDRAMDSLRRYVEDTERNLSETQKRGRTLLWYEKHEVGRSGDSHCRRDVTVEPVDQPIYFIRFGVSGEPLTDRQQKNIGFDLRLAPDSARLPFITRWESNRQVEVWAFLPEPRLPGETPVTLQLSWKWPGLFPGLVKGGSDTVGWTFRSDVNQLEYELVLSRKLLPGGRVRWNLEGITEEPKLAESPAVWTIRGSQTNPRTDTPTVVTVELS